MASTIIQPYSTATVSVPASSAIAVFSPAQYTVSTQPIFANYPLPPAAVQYNSNGYYTSSAYTAQTNVFVTAGALPLYYNVGTAPVVFENQQNFTTTPVGTLNATGTITLALIATGIITSTTAAAVTATLDTGAVLDAKATFAVGDSLEWTAINTGGTNAFTVTASTGHTIVGAAAVAANTSGRFYTVKTAASTFVTYRLS